MAQDHWHIPTCDEELVDVFLEEVIELQKSIDTNMKVWRANPRDQKTLTEIRRSFHTLKGSGRMVKALDMSEVAWKVERMLNRALAGDAPASDAMVNVVAAVRAQIPRMVDAFRNHRSIAGNREIENLMKLADSLAAGQTAPPPVQAPAARSVAPAPAATLQEVNARLERCMQRADEALHRSEMALQQARRAAGVSPEASGRPDQAAELARVRDLVTRLSREVSELRLASDKSQKELTVRQNELNQLVDQRVRARLAPNMERVRSELERDLEENRRSDAAARRFGWLAIVASALVGGLIAAALILSLPHLG